MLPAFPDKHPDTALTSFYRRKFSSLLYNYEAHLLSVSRYLNFLRTHFSSILLIYIFFYLLVKLSEFLIQLPAAWKDFLLQFLHDITIFRKCPSISHIYLHYSLWLFPLQPAMRTILLYGLSA